MTFHVSKTDKTFKPQNMKTTKLITLAGAFILAISLASAQDASVKITRPISKEVQKFSNRTWLSSEQLLTVTSVGYPSMVISKGVQLANNNIKREFQRGNMISTGYPVWTISKDVHKMVRPVKREQKPNAEMKRIIV